MKNNFHISFFFYFKIVQQHIKFDKSFLVLLRSLNVTYYPRRVNFTIPKHLCSNTVWFWCFLYKLSSVVCLVYICLVMLCVWLSFSFVIVLCVFLLLYSFLSPLHFHPMCFFWAKELNLPSISLLLNLYLQCTYTMEEIRLR